MNKYLFLLLWMVSPFFLKAQQQYLAGAVPEVNGKAVFTKTIQVHNQITDDKLFSLMYRWAESNYANAKNKLDNRILLARAKDGDIACLGGKYLVFQSSALALDRAEMAYQLILEVGNNQCKATIRNIKYKYSNQKEPIAAEEMILDEIALNKNKDKLNRYYDKFRIHTIDTVNSIFRSIDVYLNGINTTGAATTALAEPVAEFTPAKETSSSAVVPEAQAIQPIAQQQEPAVQSSFDKVKETPAPIQDMQGYKAITADKIPGNVIKLLNDAMLITSGATERTNVMAASWGGLGRFWEKPVAFCFLNPSRYSIQTMDNGDVYTLSFYTEAYRDAVQYCGSVSGRDTDKIKGSGLTPIKTPSGATAFAEAWMIIECRKLVAQPITPEAVINKDLPSDWSKNGYHKMYIGEILGVWIK